MVGKLVAWSNRALRLLSAACARLAHTTRERTKAAAVPVRWQWVTHWRAASVLAYSLRRIASGKVIAGGGPCPLICSEQAGAVGSKCGRQLAKHPVKMPKRPRAFPQLHCSLCSYEQSVDRQATWQVWWPWSAATAAVLGWLAYACKELCSSPPSPCQRLHLPQGGPSPWSRAHPALPRRGARHPPAGHGRTSSTAAAGSCTDIHFCKWLQAATSCRSSCKASCKATSCKASSWTSSSARRAGPSVCVRSSCEAVQALRCMHCGNLLYATMLVAPMLQKCMPVECRYGCTEALAQCGMMRRVPLVAPCHSRCWRCWGLRHTPAGP